MQSTRIRSITKACKEIYTLITRKFPSAYHAEYWIDYEKMLIYRSMISSAGRIFQMVFSMMAGSAIWQISEEYLKKEDNKLANADLALEYLAACKATVIALQVGRVILFIICFKWQKMTKLTLYYEMLFILMEGLMPYEIHQSREVDFQNMSIFLNVVLHYFELVPTLIASIIVSIPLFLKRAIFFE